MYCTSTNLFIDTVADGQTPCLPTIISKISVIGYIIKDNKGKIVHKSKLPKVQPTMQNSSWPCELQNIHLVLRNSGKPVRRREGLEFLPAETIHCFV